MLKNTEGNIKTYCESLEGIDFPTRNAVDRF